MTPPRISSVHSERHPRMAAGVSHGVEVDLRLIKLPLKRASSRASPNSARRNPRRRWTSGPSATRAISQRSSSGRPNSRASGASGSMTSGGVHATAVLDAGIPVDSVARRIGDDPGTTASGSGPRRRLKSLTIGQSLSLLQIREVHVGSPLYRPCPLQIVVLEGAGHSVDFGRSRAGGRGNGAPAGHGCSHLADNVPGSRFCISPGKIGDWYWRKRSVAFLCLLPTLVHGYYRNGGDGRGRILSVPPDGRKPDRQQQRDRHSRTLDHISHP
jgi:hypothetical protein